MSENESLPEWIPTDEEQRLQSVGTTSVGIEIPEHGQIALLEAIESDPGRKPFEKETRFLANAGSDVQDIYTAEPGLMRRWVLHPYFRLQWLEVKSERGTQRMNAEAFDELCSGTNSPPQIPSVYSVSGIAPVGLLKESMAPRRSGGHADIVTSKVLENDPRKDKSNGGESR